MGWGRKREKNVIGFIKGFLQKEGNFSPAARNVVKEPQDAGWGGVNPY